MSTPTVAPQNIEAEESILGAMMLSPNAIDAVMEHVRPEDFYRQSHGLMYQVMLDMHDQQLPVEALTVANELERRGSLTEVGGTARVHELAALMPAASNAAHYAKIVRDQALLRSLQRAGAEIGRLGSGAAGEIDDLLSQAEEFLSEATMSRRGQGAVSITEGLDEYVDEVRQTYLTGIPQTGTPTGFKPLDDMLLGLWPGQLILIAARPSQGKSALGYNIAENLADAGHGVLFVSLEMLRKELQERGVARAARIDSYSLRSGQMTHPEAARLKEGIDRVRGRADKLLIHDGGAITLPELKAEATRLKRTHNIEAIIVDYLQLMTPPKAENRNLEIGVISRQLKLLAMRLEIPIVAIAQLNREGTKGRPMLHHLRDSGSLEQDADVVIFLHDPAGDEDAFTANKEPTGEVDVIVEKNRKGKTDTVKLGFVKKHSAFLYIPDKPAGGSDD